MTKFDELKERFPNLIPVQELRSNVSIVELAVQYGYEPQAHKGKSRPVLEHSDYKDVIIIKNPQDPSQQVYQRAGDFSDSGTVIDFIRNRLSTVFSKFNHPGEHEFKNITSVLYDYLRIDPNHISQIRKATADLTAAGPKQQFAKEQFDIRPLEADNYLTKRNIAPETIARPEFAGKVVAQVAYFNPQTGHTDNYPTAIEHPERNYLKFTNVAFPYYNGQSSEITGMELRNENIKLHAPGSDRYSSIYVSNAPAQVKQFFVMESAIDALSHQQLRAIGGDKAFDSVYFSTGGQLTPQQVNTMTKYMGSFNKEPDWKINLAFDNDTKGHRFDLMYIQQLAATKFPMSPTVGGLGRITYLLPEQPAYTAIQEALLSRVNSFNTTLHAQLAYTDQDPLGKSVLASQQFTIGRHGDQVAIGIPETCMALTSFTRDLLELTGLDKRVAITKAHGKDFNEDLTRAVQQGQKYRYVITDEEGTTHTKGNVATMMARLIGNLRSTAETEQLTKTYQITERQPFGFRVPQVEIKLERGEVIRSTQTPAFDKQIQLEKRDRVQSNVVTPAAEKTPLNPENKPALGQTPTMPADEDHTKSKRR